MMRIYEYLNIDKKILDSLYKSNNSNTESYNCIKCYRWFNGTNTTK